MIYYISDTHFRDQAIFDKCKRPFKTLSEMEQTIINNWNKDDVFNIEDIKVVEKKKDRDFVILNFADVQTCDLDDIPNMRIIHEELTEIVNEVKPDLITLTGDQTWSNENLISLKTLVR